jgi:hypothetical protein
MAVPSNEPGSVSVSTDPFDVKSKVGRCGS